jgi:hypothetical protein
VDEDFAIGVREVIASDVTPKIDELSARLDAQAARISSLEGEQSRDKSATSALATSIEVLKRPAVTKANRDLELFERPADPAVLIISTFENADVAKSDLITSLLPWLKDANISEDAIDVSGPPLGSKFVLSLKCEGIISARLLRQAHGILRGPEVDDLGRKVWRLLECPLVVNPDTKVRIFLNFDEAPRDRRQNGSARALAKLVREDLPGKVVYTRGNTVFVGKKVAVIRAIVTNQDDDTTIQFLPAAAATFGLVGAEIKRRFVANSAPSAVSEGDWQSL